MNKELFANFNGQEIYKYTLTDSEKNSVSILNYGATIQSLVIKNKQGEFIDVVLGFDTLEEYLNHTAYFGAVCGRVCNRIEDAKFFIDAKEYTLEKNNNDACLHGGSNGFDKKVFLVTGSGSDYLELSYFSKDNEAGFPSDLLINIKYTFKNKLLLIEYTAKTNGKTPVNLTNHSYFNLNGKGDIKNHTLELKSSFYMPVRDDGVATGEIIKTENTLFDFKTKRKLGDVIDKLKEIQKPVNGLDNHFFSDYQTTDYRKFAVLQNEDESLTMEVFSNQTGAQIYTGNFIDKMKAKKIMVGENSGIAIETQLPPNALKYSYLQNMILTSEDNYYHKTGYKFY